MTSEPPPSAANPYAPSGALAHDQALASEATVQGRRRGPRLAAIVTALVTVQFPGLGLYVLGRRRFAIWIAAGIANYVTMVASAVLDQPKVFMATFATRVLLALAALVDTAVAAPAVVRPTGRRVLAAVALVFVAGLGGGTAVRTWVIEAYNIPAGSMLPTLEVGDHIMVRKTQRVERGDAIVFRYPLDPSIDYIKRVVALGGETVELRQGVVWIDGEAVPQAPYPGECAPSRNSDPVAWRAARCVLMQENIGKGRWYTVARDPHRSRDYDPYVVPPGHVFVLGDNRDNSSDSRVWGPVPIDLVEGRAFFVWWSRNDAGGEVRWDRIGRKIR